MLVVGLGRSYASVATIILSIKILQYTHAVTYVGLFKEVTVLVFSDIHSYVRYDVNSTCACVYVFEIGRVLVCVCACACVCVRACVSCGRCILGPLAPRGC